MGFHSLRLSFALSNEHIGFSWHFPKACQVHSYHCLTGMFLDYDSKAVLLVSPFLQNALRWLKSQSSSAVCSVKLDYCHLRDSISVLQGWHLDAINHFFLPGSARSQPEVIGLCLLLYLMLLEIYYKQRVKPFWIFYIFAWNWTKYQVIILPSLLLMHKCDFCSSHSIQFALAVKKEEGDTGKSRLPWKFCITCGENGPVLNVLM